MLNNLVKTWHTACQQYQSVVSCLLTSMLLASIFSRCNGLTFRVASFNIWGLLISPQRQARIDALIDRVLALEDQDGIDVLALQEVWVRNDYTYMRKRLELAYPHTIYHYSGTIGSGLALFSKFPIVDTWFREYSLSGRPDMVTHGDYYAGKGVGVALLRLSNHRHVAIINTHLVANYNRSKSDPDIYAFHRLAQTYEYIRVASQVAREHPTAGIIMLGDFNQEPHSLPFQLFVSNSAPLSFLLPATVQSITNSNHNITDWSTFNRHYFKLEPSRNSKHPFGGNSFGKSKVVSTEDIKYDSNAFAKLYKPPQQIDHMLFFRLNCIHADLAFTEHIKIDGRNSSYSDHCGLQAVFELKEYTELDSLTANNYRLPILPHQRPDEHAMKLYRQLLDVTNTAIADIINQSAWFTMIAIVSFLSLIALFLAALYFGQLNSALAIKYETYSHTENSARPYQRISTAESLDDESSHLPTVSSKQPFLMTILIMCLIIFLTTVLIMSVWFGQVSCREELSSYRQILSELAIILPHPISTKLAIILDSF